MTNIYLFIEFVKTSLFAFGGGYGTLPFIYHIANHYHWYTTKEIMQMVAIAAITPGAFGVNMATYTGYKVSGILGSIIATVALIIPSYFLSIGIYKILKKYRESKFMVDLMETLRSIASGLLLVVALQMFNQEILRFNLSSLSINFNLKGFIFLCFSIGIYFLVKKNLLLMMITTLFVGLIMLTCFHVSV